MRLILSIIGAVLILGCHSQSTSVDDTARIDRSLQRRITPDEARHILLDEVDAMAALAKSHPGLDADRQLTAWMREDLESELKTFLSRFGPADELWLYKAPGTRQQRGAETGFARVSGGKTVDHMVAKIEP